MNPMQAPVHPGSATVESALEFQRALDRALATRVEETSWGSALYHGSFPRVTDLNVLVVERDAGELDALKLIAEAERLQAGLPHRAIRLDVPDAAARMAHGFTIAGWTVSRTTVMVARRSPDRLVDLSAIQEVELAQIRVAREAAIRNVHRDLDVAAEAVEVGALQHESFPVRGFAAIVGSEIAAYCLLRTGMEMAKLVEVQAMARAQGHGVGRATIWAAVMAAREARLRPIFVESPDEEWVKSVYRRLGFDEVGTVHRFVRPWG